jgi:4-hydroxyacetophenone monooxygenase
LSEHYELIGASDEEIDDAVGVADPMVLRGLLYQLTADEAVCDTRLAPVRVGIFESFCVPNPDEVALLRQKAANLLKSYRDQGIETIDVGPRDRLQCSLGLSVGAELADDEMDLWVEESGIYPWARSFQWPRPPEHQRLQGFSVVVIGAGMGGLNAAVQLKRAGIPMTVLEKNGGVGGTWYENRYPGARVDTPSRTYSHSYGVRFARSNPYCPAEENSQYLDWIADHFDVRGDIQCNTEVQSLSWDENAREWEIAAVGPEGPFVLRANAVLSCVGFLSQPNVPVFDGAEDFAGPIFHTARWPSDFDPAGKRVATIGSGCSGYQMVPELAKVATQTLLLQRTPSWVFNTEGYLSPYSAQSRWLDAKFPYYSNYARFRSSYSLFSGYKLFALDPTFDDPHAVSADNKRIREERIEFLTAQFAGRPDLVEKMTPSNPPFSSRPVLVDSDDNVCAAIMRGDVTLVSAAIDRFTPTGIRTVDGAEYAVDAIVLATGFKANDFLGPLEVRGRGGRTIRDVWDKDGARAYLGTLVPGFPNFFMLYGPNTNPTGAGSICQVEESVTKFIVACLGHLILEARTSIDVTEDAYWRYNRELDRAEELKVYSDRRVRNYYKNEFGRSAGNSPFDGRMFWSWLRSPDGSLPHTNQWAEDWQEEPLLPYFGMDLVVE